MKFLNKTGVVAVFMNEGTQVVAGEAILIGPATSERNRIERDDSVDAHEHSAVLRKQDALATLVEGLVREHSRLVYRIAYAVLRRHQDAEDATQETFLRVLRYSAKLDSVEDPKTWLARIAWRVAVDRSRKSGKMQEVALEDPERPLAEVASLATPADEIAQGMRMENVLEKLIAALPPKLRQPLILSTIEEISPREVAAALGINEAAVRSRIFRARQILKEKLAQFGNRK
jgi:RNA polymerase sigma-70 factor, ECF subfamily